MPKASASASQKDGPSGLRWVTCGLEAPPGMKLLRNDSLARALLKHVTEYIVKDKKTGKKEVRRRQHDKQTVEFTQAEWQNFHVSKLSYDHYIKADNLRFFITAERKEADTSSASYASQLCEAARIGDSRTTSNLLQAGANVESRDTYQSTALIIASTSGHEGVAKLLLDARASTAARNQMGDTPLTKAAIKGHYKVVSLLLQRGADKEVRDMYGERPLMMAAYNDHAKVAKLLIKAAADVNARDSDGGTALTVAAFFNHVAVAKLLVDAGASINIRDKRGQSPLDYAEAEQASHKEMATIFRNHHG